LCLVRSGGSVGGAGVTGFHHKVGADVVTAHHHIW